MFSLIRKLKSLLVVETGVAQGVSSHIQFAAIDLNGKGALVSIDLPNRNPSGYVNSDGDVDPVFTPQNLQPGWLVPERLRKFWTLKLGRASDILADIDYRVNLFLHDSEHSYENMLFEFNWAYEHLVEGGILASDDTTHNNAFKDFNIDHPNMIPYISEDSFRSSIKRGIDWTEAIYDCKVYEFGSLQKQVKIGDATSGWFEPLFMDQNCLRTRPAFSVGNTVLFFAIFAGVKFAKNALLRQRTVVSRL